MEAIKKRGKDYSRYIAVFLTIIILGVLVISGPANAFSLSLNTPLEIIQRGNMISFTASVNLDDNEEADINYLTLKLDGNTEIIGRKDTVNCKFKADGEIMNQNSCKGIKIVKIDTGCYGYGCYGEGKETYVYNISIDTDNYFPGTYKTSLSVLSRGEFFEQAGNDLIIQPDGNETRRLKDCSVRGKNGIAYIEEKDFGDKSKINFYKPFSNNVRDGTGFVSGQKGRTTYSYDFKVKDIIDNGRDSIIIVAEGKYRIGIGKDKIEKSLIVLDKTNNKVKIIGQNIDVNFDNIDLKNKCYFENKS